MSDYFLADDLSGALDAAAAFHHAGRRVRIELAGDDWPAPAEDEVVGVTTETRNASPAAAAAAVGRALARGRAVGARLVYKKIDSTLRGPLAAEIDALAHALPGVRLLFCPANPAVGRTVRDGVLRVHGVPVHETEFARDPVCPVRESNLRRVLAGAGGTAVEPADAESEVDLAAAVARTAAAGGAWVGIGSGALAKPVAALARRAAPPSERQAPAPVPPGPVLLLCGSAHPANRVQAAHLAATRGVTTQVLPVTPAAADSAIAAVIAQLQSTGAASLLVEEPRHDSTAVLRAVTTAAAAIRTATGVARWFVTGGETAFACCAALGIRRLDYLAELEPGLSLSRAATAHGPLLLANKPGGFGTADAWVHAWDALRAR
jgi:uncharacterized protein YgbK (DUF1537 family)